MAKEIARRTRRAGFATGLLKFSIFPIPLPPKLQFGFTKVRSCGLYLTLLSKIIRKNALDKSYNCAEYPGLI
jgi:hypothetical protein